MQGIPRMSVDEMLWLGLLSNPGKLLSWAVIGSVLVAVVTTKIISDTVRYYDHYGYTDRVIATGIGLGTGAALAHLAITIAQAFQLAKYVYVDFAGITHYDLYTNTASDLIGGCFNLGAAIYYTIQVFKLSRKNIWVMIPVIGLNLGTFIMTLAVAGTGFNAPQATFETMMDIREFNMRRIPYFKAWGILAFLGDVAIWVAMTYYLLKVKGSVLHRQRQILGKLQTILLGTMFPPVCILLVLLATSDSRSANIGDYRRAVKYLLPPFYYLSPLHSIVARIQIKDDLNRDDDEANQDSIPLSPQGSHWPKPGPAGGSEQRGAESTIHIDPHRGKYIGTVPCSRPGNKVGQVMAGEQPAKGTLGLVPEPDQSEKPESSNTSYKSKTNQTKPSPGVRWIDHHVPQNRTFGGTETISEVESQREIVPDAVLGPMRF